MPGSYLSGIFGSSPVRPLQQHMEKVVACVEELMPFTAAVLAGDNQARDQHHNNIIDLEHDADALKKEMRLHLPNTLFMPVDRRDVLEVLTMQDMVAGGARDVSGLIVGRDMKLPEPIHQSYQELVEGCIAACKQALKAINELDELVETGFGGKVVDLVSGLLDELDDLEQKTDEQQVEIRSRIFQLESELPPVHVMFLYKVIGCTGEIADRAQKVGSRLQLMLAR